MKEKYIKITFKDNISVFIAMSQRYILADFFEDAELNEKYEIKVVKLSKREFNLLWKFCEGCYFQVKSNGKIFEMYMDGLRKYKEKV